MVQYVTGISTLPNPMLLSTRSAVVYGKRIAFTNPPQEIPLPAPLQPPLPLLGEPLQAYASRSDISAYVGVPLVVVIACKPEVLRLVCCDCNTFSLPLALGYRLRVSDLHFPKDLRLLYKLDSFGGLLRMVRRLFRPEKFLNTWLRRFLSVLQLRRI
jgi:hypothetical protein